MLEGPLGVMLIIGRWGCGVSDLNRYINKWKTLKW